MPQFWQKRFYDFNVYSAAKRREKVEYMHRNPVMRRYAIRGAESVEAARLAGFAEKEASRFERAVIAAVYGRGHGFAAILAASVLRLQCLQQAQEEREA